MTECFPLFIIHVCRYVTFSVAYNCNQAATHSLTFSLNALTSDLSLQSDCVLTSSCSVGNPRNIKRHWLSVTESAHSFTQVKKFLREHLPYCVLLYDCFGSSLYISTEHVSVSLYVSIFLPLSLCFIFLFFFFHFFSKQNFDLAIFPSFCARIQNKHSLESQLYSFFPFLILYVFHVLHQALHIFIFANVSWLPVLLFLGKGLITPLDTIGD